MLQNLVSNAVKFAGADPPVVRIDTEPHPEGWLVTVADNGPGIPADQREAVFDMFYRGHDRQVAGAGVGLGLCRRVIERHGGRIWAEPSDEGGGTAIRFTLPQTRAP